MRKKSMFLWSLLAAMTMSACSEHNELPSGEVPGGNSKANFIVKLNFEGTSMEQGGKTRAAQSTAVPETSWSNIRQVQILLYDARQPWVFDHKASDRQLCGTREMTSLPSRPLTFFVYMEV